jgi:hypothetical protein
VLQTGWWNFRVKTSPILEWATMARWRRLVGENVEIFALAKRVL